jgi:hypothetical protein
MDLPLGRALRYRAGSTTRAPVLGSWRLTSRNVFRFKSPMFVFCTVCRWDPFADALLGILPMFQPKALLPRESSIYPEPPLPHLGMSSHIR